MLNNKEMDRLFDKTSHNPSFSEVSRASSFEGKIIDFCVPVNAYFPPPAMLDMIKQELPDILKYYPDYAQAHQDNIARLIGIPSENIVVANGSTEIITLLCRDAQGPMMTSVPTFGRWTDLPAEFGVPLDFLQRDQDKNFQLSVEEIVAHVRLAGTRTLVISNPNNPTGAYLSSLDVACLVDALADLALIVIDESFIDFSGIASASRLAMEKDNLVVVKSMGKALGWHGVRLGYAVSNERIARSIRTSVPFWNINGLAAFVLEKTLLFRNTYEESFRRIASDRDYMLGRLREFREMTTYPSKANFLYCELPPGVSGKVLQQRLLEEYGILVRECGNKHGSNERYLRLAVHPRETTDLLVFALQRVLPGMAPA